jgi:hypothetical protein
MPITTVPIALLAKAAEAAPTDGSFTIDLAIWKWVVIIGLGAVAAIWIVRRLSEVIVARKTRRIIEQVVGSQAGGAGEEQPGWGDLDDLDDPGGSPDPEP